MNNLLKDHTRVSQRTGSTCELCVSVCHFPPGTSTWNMIEHRMFSHVTQNWRGRSLVSHEVIVNLIGMLMNTEVNGEHLSDEEVRSFLVNIVSAGLDTTSRQTAILVTQLLEHPEQLELLRQQPELLDQAIWESLRCYPTTGTFPRVARSDTEVVGIEIPKGSRIFIAISAANHDPSRWENPLVFDITREKQPIMSFNMGSHSCLGQNLALAEISIALQGLLDKLPNLRKDEDRWHSLRWSGYYFRSPTQLPVKWDIPS